MPENANPDHANQELWHTIFALGHPALRSFQNFHRRLPSPPRCKLCLAPFKGIGSWLMAFKGKSPSNRNPRFCSACDKFLRDHPGGAEVEMSMIFVDVRGSAQLAEKISATDFGRAMNSFYREATAVMNDTDGFIIDLVGDEVVGLYPPGFTGTDHARKAMSAVEQLLKIEFPSAPGGGQIQVGVGANTGVAYVGTVSGADAGIEDVRALGDQVNATARLAAMASPGEALLSESICQASGRSLDGLERRTLQLKGRVVPLDVRVMRREVVRAVAVT
jgi:adenylate cyclase